MKIYYSFYYKFGKNYAVLCRVTQRNAVTKGKLKS